MFENIKRRFKGGLDPNRTLEQFTSYCVAVRNGRTQGWDGLAGVDKSLYRIWEASYLPKLAGALAPLGHALQLRRVREILLSGLENSNPIAVAYHSSALSDQERARLFDGKEPDKLSAMLSYFDVMATDTVLLAFFKDSATSPGTVTHMHLSVLGATIRLKRLARAPGSDSGSMPSEFAPELIAEMGIKLYCENLVSDLRAGRILAEEDQVTSDEVYLSIYDNRVPLSNAAKMDRIGRAPVALWPFIETVLETSTQTVTLDLAKLILLDTCSLVALIERYNKQPPKEEFVGNIFDEVVRYFEVMLSDIPSETSIYTTVALNDYSVSNRELLIRWICRIGGVLSIPHLTESERQLAFLIVKHSLLTGLLELDIAFRTDRDCLPSTDRLFGQFVEREAKLMKALNTVFQ